MPISSSEIAALNGGFQGMAMNNMAYSSMIGQPPGQYGGGGSSMSGVGDRVMGGAMNRGAGVGGPLMMGAMGLVGMDPMSLGLKAGIGAFSGGAGFGGAMAAGALAAAPMAMGIGAAGYAGNQMMTGAQQTMQLNNTLRSSFNFQNQQGGQGFSRSDMTQIGGTLRSMTEQLGPGGEVTSFRELTQLTSKMGQMGLAQGVKDVQEFGKRFKEMVTNLKTMAKDLGTTLEGAMEFAHAAKGSGIFGIGNAARFASMSRTTAISGGLALSEVTGAASIGSQISRSIGGTGAQGAMAGAHAIGRIGTATQMGVLSEQDIFNVTGQTGAEGRQAYASSQMQRTASFLQSGRGRRVLASVAGKDGSLNQDAVQQLLSGDMSIDETMKKDKENLGKIGRANFVRNEGRLRGAAMEALGENLPAIQLMSWAKSKGVDINSMDDRSMLFAQRQLHMGRDEVDQAIKMANALPEITRHQQVSGQNDQIGQKVAQQRKQIGVEGIKTRFEQAKESMNSKLQKIGQDVLNTGSEQIEHFVNSLLGQYVQTMSEDTDKVYRAAMFGGAAKTEAQKMFGGASSNLQGAFKSSKRGLSQGGPGAAFASFDKGGWGNDDDFGKSPLQATLRLLGGASQRSQYEAAGFSFGNIDSLPAGEKDAALHAQISKISMQSLAANAPPSAELLAIGKENAGWMNKFYATSLGGKNGQQRVDAFGAELMNQGDPSKKALRDRWAAANDVEKVRIMSGLEGGADVPLEVRLGAKFKAPDVSGWATEGFTTEDKKREALAGNLLGLGRSNVKDFSHASAAAREAAKGNLSGIYNNDQAALAEARKYGLVAASTSSMSHNTQVAMGAEIGSKPYQDMVNDVFSSDPKTREEAKTNAFRQMAALEPKDGDEVGAGKRSAWESLAAAAEWGDVKPGERTDEKAQSILKQFKYLRKAGLSTAADLEGIGSGLAKNKGILGGEAARGEALRRVQAGKSELGVIQNGGFATVGEGGVITLKEGTLDAVKDIKGGRAVLEAAFNLASQESRLDTTTGATSAAGLVGPGGTIDKGEDLNTLISRLSTKETRSLANAAAGTDVGGRLAQAAAGKGRLEKALGKRGGGVVGAAGEGLGLTLSQEDRKNFSLDRATGAGPDTAAVIEKQQKSAAFLIDRMGIKGGGSEKFQGQVGEYLEQLRHGNVGGAEKTLQGIQGSDEAKAARKKQQEQTDEQKDPYGKKQVDLLERMVKMQGKTAEAIAAIDLADAEAKRPPAAPAP